MNRDWNADILLTQHFDTPIRFYFHEGSVDLMDITMHIHNRVHGVDSKGKHRLLHKEDILFAIPVKKIVNVRDYIKLFTPVKNLKLNRKSIVHNHFDIGDSRLESVIGDVIAVVTRGGHIIRGELQVFDKDHLLMRVGKEIVLIYRNGLLGFKKEIDATLKQNQNLLELRNTREKWVEANRINGFEEGIKRLLTDLYPDDAHFIYELLQNAEDAGASEVRFVLNKDNATFEHNGNRLFSIKDVEAITSIGFSTKKDDPTNIGKFGIGFKAVFAYTATPEIESDEFHFRIRDMVVPDTKGLFPGALGENKTRFVFPFDNPKKSPEKACAEIEKNLRQLNENTLLFLTNIRKIEYRLPDSTMGSLERRTRSNDGNRIEISVIRPQNPVPDSIHYLHFTKDFDIQDEDGKSKHCQIAAAFGIDKSEGGGWKITTLNPGQVCIYFPATKETSNLRFHLHAPFASTVARDSVRECPANDELRDHLAELIAESMHAIRDQGLLSVEFLATLPNNRDNLSPFYLPIQERLITEFNKEKLTPMKRRLSEHAAASECYRGPRALSELIKDEDLATLLGKDQSQPLWIANPQQINQREDNFLSLLDITQWESEDLVEVLYTQSDRVTEWLKGKPDEWHQDLYVLLGDFLSGAPSSPLSIARERKEKLSNLRIIRCSDGEYRVGSDCHFSGNDVESDEDLHSDITVLAEGDLLESQGKETPEENFHYVASAVYSSGSSKHQQEKAHKFLESIGVRKVDDAERVKAILEQRYRKGSIKPREGDMEKFIDLVEDQPEKKSLFKDYFIFEVDLERDDSKWFRKPSGVYVDSPYLDTGLTVYHSTLDEDSDFFKRALSPNYVESGIDLKRLVEFAKAIGVQTKLDAIEQRIPSGHPEYSYLVTDAPGGRVTSTSKNEDYNIPRFNAFLLFSSMYMKKGHFDKALAALPLSAAKLIWQTMCSQPHNCLEARFRKNSSYPDRVGASTLVYELRKAEWVPQRNGESISFVRPSLASVNFLPKGFGYEPGQEWIKAIEFGEIAKTQKEEDARRNQRAKELGFESGDEAEKAAEFFNLLKKEGKSADALLEKSRSQERRMERLIIDLSDTEEKGYEIRARSIRATRSTINSKTVLRARYTADENRMHCQMCSKGMPFKNRNSEEDYFEAVEALGKGHFFKEHEAQYLALCPECAAEYKEYVKKDPKARETFHDALKNSDNPQIHLESHGRTIRIWFEDKHWQDLKTVLYYYANVYNPDESD